MIQTICLEEQLSGLCSSTTLARAYFSFLVTVWFARLRFLLHVFLFFFFQPAIVDFINCEQCIYVPVSHKLHFLVTFLLKMSSTTLFTHLKIISLQYF